MKQWLLIMILLTAWFTGTFARAQTGEYEYGTGLPRDLDELAVPDSDYPDWPLTPEAERYASIDGERMKQWVNRICA
ncbi:MAG: hypothetical protein HKP02_12905, partial [Xanthomonadales bacterium]|nr:hypothetical protein [Xanthomonadales bacterium]